MVGKIINEVYFFKKGKNNRYVSFTDYGKVIIGLTCDSEGFYKIKDISERESAILAVKVEKCLYDYYSDIGYDNLKELLLQRGYKLAFEQPFNRISKNIKTNEMRLVMYNLDLHMIVVADTIFNMEKFNSVRCYCYGVNMQRGFIRNRMAEMGYYNCIVFNLENSNRYDLCLLNKVEEYCDRGFNGKIPKCNAPSGWVYSDTIDVNADDESENSYEFYARKFMSLCPKELQRWFE